MQDRPDSTFKFVFRKFKGISYWHFDDIVPVLRDHAERISDEVLKLFLPPHTDIAVTLLSETDTMQGPHWPREHTIRLEARPVTAGGKVRREAEIAGVYARIGIVYGYFNPRDGDGWTLEIDIHEPGSDPERIMRFSANSHSLEEKLSLSVNPDRIGYVKRIEKLLKRVFRDESVLQEDE